MVKPSLWLRCDILCNIIFLSLREGVTSQCQSPPVSVPGTRVPTKIRMAETVKENKASVKNLHRSHLISANYSVIIVVATGTYLGQNGSLFVAFVAEVFDSACQTNCDRHRSPASPCCMQPRILSDIIVST